MVTELPRNGSNLAAVEVGEEGAFVSLVISNDHGDRCAALLDASELDDLITMLRFYRTRMDK